MELEKVLGEKRGRSKSPTTGGSSSESYNPFDALGESELEEGNYSDTSVNSIHSEDTNNDRSSSSKKPKEKAKNISNKNSNNKQKTYSGSKSRNKKKHK
jgi:hypothetical protein